MFKSSQPYVVFVSLISLLGAYLLYSQTFGRITDFPELPVEYVKELPKPRRGAVAETPPPQQAEGPTPELRMAALRGFGADADELLMRPLQFESRKRTGPEAISDRGLGTFIFANDWEIDPDRPREVTLRPFNLVYIRPSESGKETEDEISTVRGEEAVLELDRDFEISHLRELSPIGGYVKGNVELRYNRRTTEDRTDDIVIIADEFHYGKLKSKVWSDGPIRVVIDSEDMTIRGTGLELELQSAPSASGSDAKTAVGEARKIRLLEDVRFDLTVADDANFLGPSLGQEDKKPAEGGTEDRTPLAVKADGPFEFDLETKTAHFSKMVKVLRQFAAEHTGEEGPIDSLFCDDLTLVFREDPARGLGQDASTSTASGKGRVGRKESLKKVVATGASVELMSKSQALDVVGRHLEYDADTRRSVIKGLVQPDGREEMVAHYKNASIYARALEIVQSSQQGGIGTVIADGPNGRLEIVDADRKPNETGRSKVSWQQRLTLSGDEDSDLRVVHITGGVELEHDYGSLLCNDLRVWLVPRSSKRLEPVKVEAKDNVSLDSDAMQVNTELLSMTILYPSPATPVTATAPAEREPSPDHERPSPLLRSAQPRDDSADRAKEPIDARASSVSVIVERSGTQTEVLQAWAEGEVLIRQSSSDPARSPFEIRGQKLTLQRKPTGDVATVQGSGNRPAAIESADFVTGCEGDIQLDETNNTINIVGPGYIVRESVTDLIGKGTAQPPAIADRLEEVHGFQRADRLL